MNWLKAIDWKRVVRTLVQVFGGVAIAFLLDWGADGVVVVRDYIFGQGGVIIAGTSFLAVLMNLPSNPQ